MADPWQLICHQTYSGTPGVIYDSSPDHGSHGQALGIGTSEFVADGVTAGSGAVRIRQDGERIYIAPSPSWAPLVGLRAEVTVRLDSQTLGLALHLGGGARWLISGYRFQFGVTGRTLFASFSQAPAPGAAGPPGSPAPSGLPKKVPITWGIDTIRTDVNGLAPNVEVPFDRWVTLGFAHDGLTTIELSIDGVAVARTVPRWPVLPELGVCIGNTTIVEFPLVGTLDEVKVWRLDPNRIVAAFFGRPMDDKTRRCWDELLRWLQRWRADNPDCAVKLDQLIQALMADVGAQIAASTSAMMRLQDVRQTYRKLWRSNRMGSSEMAALLVGFESELEKDGIDPNRRNRLRQLYESECCRRFVAELPSLNCDPEFAAYLGFLADGRSSERGGNRA
jgi:hypothetical protein